MKNESRTFLLKWLNSNCIPIQRIEDIGKGVALCSLLKKIDNSFPLFKKDPLTENDFFYNLKLVQLYFERKNQKIHFPIDKMIKLKMQDNLEVIQAIYRFVCKESPNLVLGREEIQKNSNGIKNSEINSSSIKSSEINSSSIKSSEIHFDTINSNGINFDTINSDSIKSSEIHFDDTSIPGNEKAVFYKLNEPVITNQLNEQIQELKEQNSNLISLTEKLKDCATIMQNERNFYFEKLVQIEKYLTDNKDITKEKVLRILYKV